MGKSCSFGLQYVFCSMLRENNSLNKGDVHNCRLYYKMEVEGVCACCKDDKTRGRLV